MVEIRSEQDLDIFSPFRMRLVQDWDGDRTVWLWDGSMG